jgi:hypothetical protein
MKDATRNGRSSNLVTGLIEAGRDLLPVTTRFSATTPSGSDLLWSRVGPRKNIRAENWCGGREQVFDPVVAELTSQRRPHTHQTQWQLILDLMALQQQQESECACVYAPGLGEIQGNRTNGLTGGPKSRPELGNLPAPNMGAKDDLKVL